MSHLTPVNFMETTFYFLFIALLGRNSGELLLQSLTGEQWTFNGFDVINQYLELCSLISDVFFVLCVVCIIFVHHHTLKASYY